MLPQNARTKKRWQLEVVTYDTRERLQVHDFIIVRGTSPSSQHSVVGAHIAELSFDDKDRLVIKLGIGLTFFLGKTGVTDTHDIFSHEYEICRTPDDQQEC